MPIHDFSDNFLVECLNKIALLDNTCILMGEYNIDLLEPHANNITSKFLEVMISCFFVPYIQQPTCVVGSFAMLIDNIFVNSVEFVTFQVTCYVSLLTIYCNSLSLRIPGYLTGQNMNKYSNVIIHFSITINLKTKLIK